MKNLLQTPTVFRVARRTLITDLSNSTIISSNMYQLIDIDGGNSSMKWKFLKPTSVALLHRQRSKITSSVAPAMRADRVQHIPMLFSAIQFPSLRITIISNNIQLKFVSKDVSIQNAPTIHNLFDLIILKRECWGSKAKFALLFLFLSVLLGRGKYLIKRITMDETCNTRKRWEKMK